MKRHARPDERLHRTNGKMVAEQIGSQIFIDGWGMVPPGDPERPPTWPAERPQVSHDGEAIYGAQVLAAMVAQAFVEPRPGCPPRCRCRLIPRTRSSAG